MAVIEKTYQTPYGEIHYFISKLQEDKPWLVFLPGLTADHTLFDKQMEYFSEAHNCFVWDAPAHGHSRPFALRFSMEDLVEYLHTIFEAEEIYKPILVGQSLGGYISQAYIERYPDKVSGFVSIDSCSLKRKYYTGWELALLKRTKGMYMSIPWKMLIKWGSNGTATTEYGRSLMKKMMESFEKEEYCALADHGYRMLAEAVELNLPYELKCPVLLICGEKDGAGSAKSYNRRWEKSDGHRLVWIPGAGHNANTDAPEIVNQLIEKFVYIQTR